MARRGTPDTRDDLLGLASHDPLIALVVAMIETARREAEAGNVESCAWLDQLAREIRGDDRIIPWPLDPGQRRAA
jgi:hypothetical protein